MCNSGIVFALASSAHYADTVVDDDIFLRLHRSFETRGQVTTIKGALQPALASLHLDYEALLKADKVLNVSQDEPFTLVTFFTPEVCGAVKFGFSIGAAYVYE